MTSSSPLAPEDPNEKLIFQRLEDQTGVKMIGGTIPRISLMKKEI